MDYKNLKQSLTDFSGRGLEQRKHWYSPAAEAYDKTRPHDPQDLIRQVIKIAQLTSASNILEVGCGLATATVDFAQLGCSILCLEPNPNFHELAQQNCRPYPRVEILNTAFEEWVPEIEKFNIESSLTLVESCSFLIFLLFILLKNVELDRFTTNSFHRLQH